MLTLSDSNKLYPSQLKRLHSPPSQLYIKSNNWEELSQMPMLAVVGTRKPTTYGNSACSQFVREIASRAVVIVSGLALGIDSIAHKATLEAGGKTIAVLPSGFDHIYPASHRHLAQQILDTGGALVSEYTPKTSASFKGNFIQRNRIIAGLSSAVFIPEAASKSGSLHTAQFALESGIDICVLPGQINNPLSEGCHNLIKTGAALVTSAQDILQILNIYAGEHTTAPIASNQQEQIILDLINKGIFDGDELLRQSELSVDEFNQTLTMLEITGKIAPIGGNSWRLS